MKNDNVAAVRNAYAVAERKDLEGWINLFTPDGVFVDNSVGATYRGRALADPVRNYGTAFSNMHRELYRVYADGNVVVVQLALQGTNDGPLQPFVVEPAITLEPENRCDLGGKGGSHGHGYRRKMGRRRCAVPRSIKRRVRAPAVGVHAPGHGGRFERLQGGAGPLSPLPRTRLPMGPPHARRLKRLENVISISLADLPRKRSWAYSKGIGRDLEPADGVFELHQAYISAVPNYTGRVTATHEACLFVSATAPARETAYHRTWSMR
jgi:SnoaL-like domain